MRRIAELIQALSNPVRQINWIQYALAHREEKELKPVYPDASKQVRKNGKALEKKRAEAQGDTAQSKVIQMRRAK